MKRIAAGSGAEAAYQATVSDEIKVAFDRRYQRQGIDRWRSVDESSPFDGVEDYPSEAGTYTAMTTERPVYVVKGSDYGLKNVDPVRFLIELERVSDSARQ